MGSVRSRTLRPMGGSSRRAAASWRPIQILWAVLIIAAGAGVVFDRFHHLPDRASGGIAVAFAVLATAGLWARMGSPIWAAAGIVVIYGGAAVGLQNDLMLRGACLMTAAITAVFAVLVTIPASRFRHAVVEVVIADVVAIAGGFAAAAYHVDLNYNVFRYGALFIALIGAFAAVYRPGAGLHGLGRRGYVLIGGIAVLLIFLVGYSLALTHYGSHYVADTVDNLRNWTHDNIGAAPHLLDVVIGVPSLCWGVFTRARRRQGWWMCAFGVAFAAPAATCLLSASSTRIDLLGALYSLILGVIVGYLVVRIEQFFTGSHGRRARRTEEASAHRPEPARWAPLR